VGPFFCFVASHPCTHGLQYHAPHTHTHTRARTRECLRGVRIRNVAAKPVARVDACHTKHPTNEPRNQANFEHLLACIALPPPPLWWWLLRVEQVLLTVRQFDASKLRPRTLSYDPTGAYLLVGFTSGAVKLLDPASLDDVATFKSGRDPVTLASFSPRGDFFATADAGAHEEKKAHAHARRARCFLLHLAEVSTHSTTPLLPRAYSAFVHA